MFEWLATIFMMVGGMLETIGHLLWHIGQRG
jgi:hypothetical protein